MYAIIGEEEIDLSPIIKKVKVTVGVVVIVAIGYTLYKQIRSTPLIF